MDILPRENLDKLLLLYGQEESHKPATEAALAEIIDRDPKLATMLFQLRLAILSRGKAKLDDQGADTGYGSADDLVPQFGAAMRYWPASPIGGLCDCRGWKFNFYRAIEDGRERRWVTPCERCNSGAQSEKEASLKKRGFSRAKFGGGRKDGEE